jgi:hypothetical protein
MLLSNPEQDEFFNNYLPLLYYASMYEGLLEEGSTLSDFIGSTIESKVQSRNALFTDPDILNYYRQDNGHNLPNGGAIFLDDVEHGMLSEFVVVKQYQNFSVLKHIKDESFLQVMNISEPFSELLSSIPHYITTAIFNFNGKIICDGLLTGGIGIGPNMEKDLLYDYRLHKQGGKVVKLLP